MLLSDYNFIFIQGAIGSSSFMPVLNSYSALVLVLLFLLFGLILFFKDYRFLYLLLAGCILIFNSINFLITGLDTALYFYLLVLASLTPGKKKSDFNQSFLIFSISWIYFFSGFTKLLTPEWRHGTYLSYLAQTNVCYEFARVFISTFMISKLICYLVIVLELLAPFLLWKKNWRFTANKVFIVFHLVLLITMKIPHLSLLMIAYHFYMQNERLVLNEEV